jgi:hypothetical protein
MTTSTRRRRSLSWPALPVRRARPPRRGQASQKSALLGAGLALGLLQQDPAAWFGTAGGTRGRCGHPGIDRRTRRRQAGARLRPCRCDPRPVGRRRHCAGRHCPGRTLVAQALMTPNRIPMSHRLFPLEPTAAEAQTAIAEEFAFFGDWSERYQYLIDLGRKLPTFPEELEDRAAPVAGLPVDGLDRGRRATPMRCASMRSATRRSCPG